VRTNGCDYFGGQEVFDVAKYAPQQTVRLYMKAMSSVLEASINRRWTVYAKGTNKVIGASTNYSNSLALGKTVDTEVSWYMCVRVKQRTGQEEQIKRRMPVVRGKIREYSYGAVAV